MQHVRFTRNRLLWGDVAPQPPPPPPPISHACASFAIEYFSYNPCVDSPPSPPPVNPFPTDETRSPVCHTLSEVQTEVPQCIPRENWSDWNIPSIDKNGGSIPDAYTYVQTSEVAYFNRQTFYRFTNTATYDCGTHTWTKGDWVQDLLTSPVNTCCASPASWVVTNLTAAGEVWATSFSNISDLFDPATPDCYCGVGWYICWTNAGACPGTTLYDITARYRSDSGCGTFYTDRCCHPICGPYASESEANSHMGDAGCTDPSVGYYLVDQVFYMLTEDCTGYNMGHSFSWVLLASSAGYPNCTPSGYGGSMYNAILCGPYNSPDIGRSHIAGYVVSATEHSGAYAKQAGTYNGCPVFSDGTNFIWYDNSSSAWQLTSALGGGSSYYAGMGYSSTEPPTSGMDWFSWGAAGLVTGLTPYCA